MSEQFSAAWWNEQAAGAGKLSKADIERLTGQRYDTIAQNAADGTIIPWYLRVKNEAPGFNGSGLLLQLAGTATKPSVKIADDPAAWANYPDNAYYVSAVGYVAPGTTVAYTPELQTTYVPETTVSGSAAGIPNYTPGVPGQVGTGSTYGQDPAPLGTGGVPFTDGDQLVPNTNFLANDTKAGVPATAIVSGATQTKATATTSASDTIKTVPVWVWIGIGVAGLLALRKKS